ncbi:hypothetical protein OG226_07930 [Streptomyces sp. NBC_01261]|uniref:hypothetical protein n=1 Tax=Streptomyces sp. NBC_01261 TaxID=2903802 RepID=UPI002E33B1F5|nr:hypothetical protein [Streptomyces sp. NBC_01261]
MAADWWARGIALGSTAAASLNMITSYRTYRRTRPDVVVKFESQYLFPEVNKFGFRMRIVNQGATALGIESVTVEVKHVSDGQRFFKVEYSKLPIVEHFDEPLIVAAFSGQQYVKEFEIERGVFPSRYVRFVLQLTDGSKRRSRKYRDFYTIMKPLE